jgi:predicted ribosomally synthesized peptide with SipW-like signal peptide
MTEKSTGLTRRKILGGTAALAAAAAAGAGGTFALLSDTEQSTNNSLSVGTLDLATEGTESATTTLSVSNEGTGTSGQVSTEVNNQGSLDGFLNFDVGTVDDKENGVVDDAEQVSGENGGSPGELAQYVTFRLGYDGNDNGTLGSDEIVAEGRLSDGGRNYLMDNVQFNPNVPIPAGGDRDFYLEWEIDGDAGNEVQSDSVEVDFTFELLERERGADVVLTGNTTYGQGAGFAEAWDTTADSGTPDIAHSGSGAWGTVDHGSGSYKQGFYFAGDFSSISPLKGYTIDQIAEISYWLYEPNPLNGNDIYLVIYTRPEGDGNDGDSWYDSRLEALPTNANGGGSPNFTPGQWNMFSTSGSASNTLVFDDNGHKTGNSVGGPILPTLSDLQNNVPLDWGNYDSSPSQGDTDTSDNTIDYANQEVLALSLQTNSTSPELKAWIDDITVELTTGEELTIDLEP